MSEIGFPTLYTPGHYSHEISSAGRTFPKHRGDQWQMTQWGDELQLTHRDAVSGRLRQEWTAAATDDVARDAAARFSTALDSMPAEARFNAWSERAPIYVSADAVHVHPAHGSYVGVRTTSPEARGALDDALRALADFTGTAHTEGAIRQPLLTPTRAALAAGVVLGVGLVVADRIASNGGT